MLNHYCERISAGLFSEPLNACTNISFFIAAWATWNLAKMNNSLSIKIRMLVFLSVMIGIGSTLFHILATNWAQWFDFIPIMVFQFCFTWFYFGRLSGIIPALATIFLTGFLGYRFPGALDGSLVYAPAVMTMAGLGLYHFQCSHSKRLILVVATGVFLLSLGFRTIDDAVCPRLPTGTHFLWHLLNGVLLYLSMAGVIFKNGNRPKNAQWRIISSKWTDLPSSTN